MTSLSLRAWVDMRLSLQDVHVGTHIRLIIRCVYMYVYHAHMLCTQTSKSHGPKSVGLFLYTYSTVEVVGQW